MAIGAIIDWIVLLPLAIKLMCAITVFILVIGYVGMRPQSY